jgi:carboxyl-terminal processing protease
LAVHSLKDLPTTSPEGLQIAAFSYREDPRDLLIIRKDAYDPSTGLGVKAGGRIGTSSARRKVQIALLQPDLDIIDLRGNPGGLLDSAQRILGYFYQGTSLWEQRAAGSRRELLTISPDGLLTKPTQPIIVLMNGDSASASEVVAGALRDKYPNTQLIGVQSFGKGIVQSIYPLSNGGTARLTVSQWLTPNLYAIHKQGLTPDVIVEDTEDAPANAPCVANRRPATGQTLCRDPQLMRALEVLQP